MHPNAELITRFYEAFQRRDAAAMNACYHPDIVFEDPAFGRLQAADARTMWVLLCSRAKDLEITFRDVEADDRSGCAHWEARYLFSQTGRRVHNKIDAEFGFRDGLIVEHNDGFSFWDWSRQAMGAPGLLLGWSPFLKARVQKNARGGLDAFRRSGRGST